MMSPGTVPSLHTRTSRAKDHREQDQREYFPAQGCSATPVHGSWGSTGWHPGKDLGADEILHWQNILCPSRRAEIWNRIGYWRAEIWTKIRHCSMARAVPNQSQHPLDQHKGEKDLLSWLINWRHIWSVVYEASPHEAGACEWVEDIALLRYLKKQAPCPNPQLFQWYFPCVSAQAAKQKKYQLSLEDFYINHNLYVTMGGWSVFINIFPEFFSLKA